MLRQISVFIENKRGRLFSFTKALADKGVDIKALSIADTSKFGILRMIVSDPERVLKLIKEANFTASVTEVLCIEVKDRPGGLSAVLEVLKDNDIAVEYLYSFVSSKNNGDALIVFKVDEPIKAAELLKDTGLELVTEDTV